MGEELITEELPFLGDVAGYTRWAVDNWRPNPWWCVRHWAPAPTQGQNGLLASTILTERAVKEVIPREVLLLGADGKNKWLFGECMFRPVCCRLGDDKMAELWAEVKGL